MFGSEVYKQKLVFFSYNIWRNQLVLEPKFSASFKIFMIYNYLLTCSKKFRYEALNTARIFEGVRLVLYPKYLVSFNIFSNYLLTCSKKFGSRTLNIAGIFQGHSEGTSSVAIEVLITNCKIDFIRLFIFSCFTSHINFLNFNCLMMSNFCFRNFYYLSQTEQNSCLQTCVLSSRL